MNGKCRKTWNMELPFRKYNYTKTIYTKSSFHSNRAPIPCTHIFMIFMENVLFFTQDPSVGYLTVHD